MTNDDPNRPTGPAEPGGPTHRNEYPGVPTDAPARLSAAGTIGALLVLVAVVAGCGGGLLSLGAALNFRIAGAWGLWGVWVAPLLSLLGVGLGLWSLRTIRHSEGAVVGKPAALIGVFLGLMVTALLGATALASLATMAGPEQLRAPVARVITASGEGRFTDARGALGESASRLSDAELAWFAGVVEREVGPFTGTRAGLELISEGPRVMRESPGAADAVLEPSEMPKPLFVLGEGGESGERTLVYVWLDEAGLLERKAVIKDLLIITGPNTVAVLRSPGPALLLSGKLGWEAERFPGAREGGSGGGPEPGGNSGEEAAQPAQNAGGEGTGGAE